MKEIDSNSSLPKGIVIAHLILDVGTTVLTLVESIAPPTAPFVAPVILAITFARLAIDDGQLKDGQYNHLIFEVLFHDIKVTRSGNDIFLSSLSSNDSVRVRISNYFLEESYQHLLVHSADDVLFKFTSESPYIEVILIDYSTAVYSQVINADDNSTFEGARVIVGSRVAENYIRGGNNTTKITGGSVNDTIVGGPGGEDLFGGDGDDIIYGGHGNDVLYGGDGNDILDGGTGDDILYAGMGADVINGSSGTNTVIFSGYNFTGVIVDLQVGLGWDTDAEGDSYSLISNIVSSSFDDTLIGNDLDNTIRGHGGEDFIYPAGGDDILNFKEGEGRINTTSTMRLVTSLLTTLLLTTLWISL